MVGFNLDRIKSESMKTLLMGIDIGTSACKVTLFTIDEKAEVSEDSKYSVYYPQPGWVEQNPEEWWNAVCYAVRSLLYTNNIQPKDIAGIGIAGQSWSAIPLDKNGEVLHNTPIWMDTRAAEICEEIRNKIDEDQIFNLCGNPLQPTYTLPKILWFKKHLPGIYAKTEKFLQSNSFIAYKLTGVISHDLSQGYGLHCFDMRRGVWDVAFCSEFGVTPDLLPELVPSHQVIGTVTEHAARLTGLQAGIPVVAGGLDAACGALGAGVLKPGETQEQGGQAGGMSICMDHYTADPRLILGFHVVPGCWLLQGGTVGGGTIRWMEQEFGEAERQIAKENESTSYAVMDQEAEEIDPGCDGLVLLPYMSGERSPLWDEKAKGVIFGLDYSKTRKHLIRAGMEGVAYSLRHNLEVAESVGVTVAVLRAVGGAAKSRLWTQIKADVTGKRIIVPSSREATTLGSAILAGVGTGVFSSFDEAVAQTVDVTKEYYPDESTRSVYDHNYRIYKELYESLKEIMHRQEAN